MTNSWLTISTGEIFILIQCSLMAMFSHPFLNGVCHLRPWPNGAELAADSTMVPWFNFTTKIFQSGGWEKSK